MAPQQAFDNFSCPVEHSPPPLDWMVAAGLRRKSTRPDCGIF
jgi:hypothetical protein